MNNSLIDRLQAAWPVNRLVVLLTPAFVAISGWIAAWAAQNLPGVPSFDEEWLTAVFVAGAGSALAAVYKWIDGWQKHEQVQRVDEALDKVREKVDALNDEYYEED